MRYIKVDNVEYPVLEITGKMKNADWDNRESKTIHLEMTHAQAIELFQDGTEWSIVEEWDEDSYDEENQQAIVIPRREEYDNSDFNIAGDVIDHRDGTISITMGKETDLEEAYELLYGGEE